MIRFLFRFFRWTFLLFLILGLIIAAVALWLGMPDYLRGQNITSSQLDFAVVITDRNGKELYRKFENENREWATLNEIPESMSVMTLLAEDRRFYEHFGIDVKGVARAVVENVKAGGVVQGGSTLTQQLAKKMFLSDERTFTRKLREVGVSLGIESALNKDEILEMYMNTAPYGPTVAGVSSAANHYFKKTVDQLTEAESLVLSAMPKDPVRLARKSLIRQWQGTCTEPVTAVECNPFNPNAGYLPSRLDALLDVYIEHTGQGVREKQKLWRELSTMELNGRSQYAFTDYQQFQFYIQDFLAQKGVELLDYPGGLRITTTLDAPLHEELYAYMREEMGPTLFSEWGAENFSLVVLDHKTRGPLTWIGTKAFWNEAIDGQVDMIRSRRQLGSAVKPFIYFGMFQQGFEPNTWLYDIPVRFANERHVLRNADGIYKGTMSVAKSLAQSRNVPAAQALYLMGGETKAKNMLQGTFGFDIKKLYGGHFFGWTIALGTVPMKLINGVNAYATLGSGELKEVCPILKLETMTGEALPLPCEQQAKSKLTEEDRFFLWNMMSDSNYQPTGYWRDLLNVPGYEIAAKTGTSNKRAGDMIVPGDNVLASYTPNASMLLWAGNTDGKPLKEGAFAISVLGPYHAPLWQKVLEKNPELYSTLEPPSTLTKQGLYWRQDDAEPQKPLVKGMTVLGGATYGSGSKSSVAQPRAQSVQPKIQQAVQPVIEAAPATPAALPAAPRAPRARPTKESIRQNILQRYQ